MSLVEKVADVDNAFLARREITCNFAGLGGRLTRLDAVDAVSKEYGLGGKAVVPMGLRSQVGRTVITGTFYVYGDEESAKRHVRRAVFERIGKDRKARAEKEAAEAEAEASAKESAEAEAGAKDGGGDAAKEEGAQE